MELFKGTKGKWDVVEHSWSDTSIVCGDKNIATLSIYDEATEETQEALEYETTANFNLMAAALNLLKVLQEADEYLKGNKQNYIGNGSKLHAEFKAAIKTALHGNNGNK